MRACKLQPSRSYAYKPSCYVKMTHLWCVSNAFSAPSPFYARNGLNCFSVLRPRGATSRQTGAEPTALCFTPPTEQPVGTLDLSPRLIALLSVLRSRGATGTLELSLRLSLFYAPAEQPVGTLELNPRLLLHALDIDATRATSLQ